jgi:hypothetical protein
MDSSFATFKEFWPFYLREHSHPKTRLIHVWATAAALSFLSIALLTGNMIFAVVAVVAGYGPAWLAHSLIQKNRPATFRYPLWSFCADIRMFALWVTARLPRELAKYNIQAS